MWYAFSPEVELCGYTIPHPLEAKMNMRIQTSPNKTANQALRDGLLSLVKYCDESEVTFNDGVNKFDAERDTNEHK